MSGELPPLLFSSAGTTGVSYIVCIVPRRGLQQCYNNISVFIILV